MSAKKRMKLDMAGGEGSQSWNFPASAGKRAFKCQHPHPPRWPLCRAGKASAVAFQP